MGKNLQDKIETLLDNYFKDLDGEKPNDVYNMVLHSVEKPLLIYI